MADEKLQKHGNGSVEGEEEEEEKWVKYYSNNHQILLVGEGDFSFSLSLAHSFGSASNIVATSLDSLGEVQKKYKKALSNLDELQKLGAILRHEVDATKMNPHLKMRRFDRIIFNFPHAGFHGREDNLAVINKHKKLVHGFFMNARDMLRPNGEIHVNHKTTPPFNYWQIELLANHNNLILIGCADFKKEDFPGYNNKRGDSARCDEPFPLGKCSTFKFSLCPNKAMKENVSHIHNYHNQRNHIPSVISYSNYGYPQTMMLSGSVHGGMSWQPWPPLTRNVGFGFGYRQRDEVRNVDYSTYQQQQQQQSQNQAYVQSSQSYNGYCQQLQQEAVASPGRTRCEICEVECITAEMLEQHKNGKRHRKSMQLQGLEAVNGHQLNLRVEVEKPPEGCEADADGNPKHDLTWKRKMRSTEYGLRRQVDAMICELCNVKCESEVVYESHLRGKKHLANLKCLHANLALFAASAMPNTNTIDINAVTNSINTQVQQGFNDPQVLLAHRLITRLSQTQASSAGTLAGFLAAKDPEPALGTLTGFVTTQVPVPAPAVRSS